MRRLILALSVTLGLTAPALAQGTLRVAVGTTLNQLDPAKTTIGDEYIYVHLVFNGLTRIDPDLSVKPDLAVSWTASDDLKVWTFKLREGVKFHHGRAFEAEDVLATMNRILDPATGSRARANLSMIEKIEAPDPTTVRFALNIPYAGFPDIFAERQLRILAKDRIDAISKEPVGTGPFVFKSWSPGDRLELAKNPGYFEQGLPKLDAVTMRIIPEAAARLAALESGAIDILWNLPYEAVDKFKNHPNVRADGVATATWDGVILNNERAPFNDVRVRQALAATIDKDALVELALFGQGEPTHSPIPPSHPYFNKKLGFKKPDIALAKKLRADAGHPNGFEVPLQVPQEREQCVRLGVAVRDMARAAGIRINVERVPFASCGAGRRQGADVCRWLFRPADDRYRGLSLLPLERQLEPAALALHRQARRRDPRYGPQDQRRRQAKGAFRRVPKDRRRDGAEPHRLCGCACERRPQGGRGISLDTDAVARPEGSHA